MSTRSNLNVQIAMRIKEVENTNQHFMYDTICLSLIHEFIYSNNHMTFISFGPYNNGKTYTLIGNDTDVDNETTKGILPRIIYDVINRLIILEVNICVQYVYYVSFIEIYNDIVIDLLSVNNSESNYVLDIDELGYTHIHGVCKMQCYSYEDVLTYLKLGLQKRNKKCMDGHVSSLSHVVFTFHAYKLQDGVVVKYNKMIFIDLTSNESENLIEESVYGYNEYYNSSYQIIYDVIANKYQFVVPNYFTAIHKYLQDAFNANIIKPLKHKNQIDFVNNNMKTVVLCCISNEPVYKSDVNNCINLLNYIYNLYHQSSPSDNTSSFNNANSEQMNKEIFINYLRNKQYLLQNNRASQQQEQQGNGEVKDERKEFINNLESPYLDYSLTQHLRQQLQHHQHLQQQQQLTVPQVQQNGDSNINHIESQQTFYSQSFQQQMQDQEQRFQLNSNLNHLSGQNNFNNFIGQGNFMPNGHHVGEQIENGNTSHHVVDNGSAVGLSASNLTVSPVEQSAKAQSSPCERKTNAIEMRKNPNCRPSLCRIEEETDDEEDESDAYNSSLADDNSLESLNSDEESVGNTEDVENNDNLIEGVYAKVDEHVESISGNGFASADDKKDSGYDTHPKSVWKDGSAVGHNVVEDTGNNFEQEYVREVIHGDEIDDEATSELCDDEDVFDDTKSIPTSEVGSEEMFIMQQSELEACDDSAAAEEINGRVIDRCDGPTALERQRESVENTRPIREPYTTNQFGVQQHQQQHLMHQLHHQQQQQQQQQQQHLMHQLHHQPQQQQQQQPQHHPTQLEHQLSSQFPLASLPSHLPSQINSLQTLKQAKNRITNTIKDIDHDNEESEDDEEEEEIDDSMLKTKLDTIYAALNTQIQVLSEDFAKEILANAKIKSGNGSVLKSVSSNLSQSPQVSNHSSSHIELANAAGNGNHYTVNPQIDNSVFRKEHANAQLDQTHSHMGPVIVERVNAININHVNTFNTSQQAIMNQLPAHSPFREPTLLNQFCDTVHQNNSHLLGTYVNDNLVIQRRESDLMNSNSPLTTGVNRSPTHHIISNIPTHLGGNVPNYSSSNIPTPLSSNTPTHLSSNVPNIVYNRPNVNLPYPSLVQNQISSQVYGTYDNHNNMVPRRSPYGMNVEHRSNLLPINAMRLQNQIPIQQQYGQVPTQHYYQTHEYKHILPQQEQSMRYASQEQSMQHASSPMLQNTVPYGTANINAPQFTNIGNAFYSNNGVQVASNSSFDKTHPDSNLTRQNNPNDVKSLDRRYVSDTIGTLEAVEEPNQEMFKYQVPSFEPNHFRPYSKDSCNTDTNNRHKVHADVHREDDKLNENVYANLETINLVDNKKLGCDKTTAVNRSTSSSKSKRSKSSQERLTVQDETKAERNDGILHIEVQSKKDTKLRNVNDTDNENNNNGSNKVEFVGEEELFEKIKNMNLRDLTDIHNDFPSLNNDANNTGNYLPNACKKASSDQEIDNTLASCEFQYVWNDIDRRKSQMNIILLDLETANERIYELKQLINLKNNLLTFLVNNKSLRKDIRKKLELKLERLNCDLNSLTRKVEELNMEKLNLKLKKHCLSGNANKQLVPFKHNMKIKDEHRESNLNKIGNYDDMDQLAEINRNLQKKQIKTDAGFANASVSQQFMLNEIGSSHIDEDCNGSTAALHGFHSKEDKVNDLSAKISNLKNQIETNEGNINNLEVIIKIIMQSDEQIVILKKNLIKWNKILNTFEKLVEDEKHKKEQVKNDLVLNLFKIKSMEETFCSDRNKLDILNDINELIEKLKPIGHDIVNLMKDSKDVAGSDKTIKPGDSGSNVTNSKTSDTKIEEFGKHSYDNVTMGTIHDASNEHITKMDETIGRYNQIHNALKHADLIAPVNESTTCGMELIEISQNRDAIVRNVETLSPTYEQLNTMIYPDVFQTCKDKSTSTDNVTETNRKETSSQTTTEKTAETNIQVPNEHKTANVNRRLIEMNKKSDVIETLMNDNDKKLDHLLETESSIETFGSTSIRNYKITNSTEMSENAISAVSDKSNNVPCSGGPGSGDKRKKKSSLSRAFSFRKSNNTNQSEKSASSTTTEKTSKKIKNFILNKSSDKTKSNDSIRKKEDQISNCSNQSKLTKDDEKCSNCSSVQSRIKILEESKHSVDVKPNETETKAVVEDRKSQDSKQVVQECLKQSQENPRKTSQEQVKNEIKKLLELKQLVVEKRIKLFPNKCTEHTDLNKKLFFEYDESIETIDNLIEHKSNGLIDSNSSSTLPVIETNNDLYNILINKLINLNYNELILVIYKYFNRIIDLRTTTVEFEKLVQNLDFKLEMKISHLQEMNLKFERLLQNNQISNEKHLTLLQKDYQKKLHLFYKCYCNNGEHAQSTHPASPDQSHDARKVYLLEKENKELKSKIKYLEAQLAVTNTGVATSPESALSLFGKRHQDRLLPANHSNQMGGNKLMQLGQITSGAGASSNKKITYENKKLVISRNK